MTSMPSTSTTSPAPPDLGTLKATYHTDQRRTAARLIVGGALVVLGLISLLALPSNRQIFGWGLLVIAGAVMASTWLRNANIEIDIYERGVYYRRRGQEQRWGFSEFDGIRINGTGGRRQPGQGDGKAERIGSVQFYRKGQPVLSIGPDIPNWQKAAAAIEKPVLDRLSGSYLAALHRGREVVFDRLRRPTLLNRLFDWYAPAPPLTLTLTRDGIRRNAERPLPWTEVARCDIRDNVAVVVDKQGRTRLRFVYYGGVNSAVAVRVINGYVGAASPAISAGRPN